MQCYFEVENSRVSRANILDGDKKEVAKDGTLYCTALKMVVES